MPKAARIIATICALVAFGRTGAAQDAPVAQSAPAVQAAPAAAAEPVDNRPRIAVIDILPGEGVDPRDAWIGPAVQDVLTWRMRRVPRVVAIPSVRLHQARQELIDDAANPPSWARVAELLGAQKRVSGRFTGLVSGVTLELELISITSAAGTPGATASAAEAIRIGPAPLFDALDEATRWLLERLGASEIDEPVRARIFGAVCKSTSALEYATKASQALLAENTRDAVYYGEQAIQYDPLFRPAQLMLAQIDIRRSAATRAEASLRLRQVALLAEKAGDRTDRIEAEILLGIVLQLIGSDEPAEQRLQNALSWADEIRDPYARIAAMSTLSELYLTRRPHPAADMTDAQRVAARKADARRAAEWQVVVLRELAAIGDLIAEAPSANKLALIYEQLSESALAFEMHERTLAAARRVGSRRTEATAQMFLGQWYRRHDNLPGARSAFEKCFELATESARPTIRIALADVEQAAGQPDKALAQLRQAYEALKNGDDLVNQLRCLRGMAELQHAAGNAKEALVSLQDALDIASALELPEKVAISKQLNEWRSARP